MKVYFVSGLGADERVFHFLQLAPIEPVYIKWIKPQNKEPLQHYVSRLIADQIDTSEEVRLVGISFGGIICQEIGKQIPYKKIVIISSVKNAREMGVSYEWLRKIRADRWIPNVVMKWSNLLTCDYFFGAENKEESKLLHQIIEETDWDFARWAIDQLLLWDNKQPLSRLVHLHGKKDKVFPIGNINDCVALPGGHLMVVGRAEEVSRLLKREFTVA